MQTERQKQIIKSSIKLIATKGIQGLTIKNLSKEIGISVSAIYRHFVSKNEIILTILDNIDEMFSFMKEVFEEIDRTSVNKIELMFSKIIEILSTEPSLISIIFYEEIFKSEVVFKEKIVGMIKSKEEIIEDIIKEGQDKGEIRADIGNKTLALIIIGALRFRVKQWDLKNQRENLKIEGNVLINGIKTILQP